MEEQEYMEEQECLVEQEYMNDCIMIHTTSMGLLY